MDTHIESTMAYPATKTAAFNPHVPRISLLVTAGLLALHHQYAMSTREYYPSIVLFLSLFGGLATAGSLHAPLFYSLGKYGSHLPLRLKIIAAASALTGFAVGLDLMIRFY